MFELKYKKIILLLVLFAFISLTGFALVVLLSLKAEGKTWLIFLCVVIPLSLVCAVAVIDFLHHKIIINNGWIIIIRLFAKKEYLFEDMESYEEFKLHKERLHIYFKGGQSISVDKFYTNYEAFAEMIRKTGKLKKRDNTEMK